MAKPRVFISSTHFDLKILRSDIESFIKTQGYDPVLSEKGHIPYGSEEKLEEYCYKEIELCDILIAVIGGKFGSESRVQNYSISNYELKTAIDKGKQVYIFIEKSVASEYKLYDANKDIKGITYTAVDDTRIYEFLDEVYSLPINNQIKEFETAHEMNSYLREQWAGLFQRLLSNIPRQKEVDLVSDLKNTSNTLNQLVGYLIDEKDRGNEVVNNILLSNHPAFEELKQKAKIPYRVIFYTKDELRDLLNARQYEEGIEFLDDWARKNYFTWKLKKDDKYLVINECIFDEQGKLRVYTPDEWESKWIEISYEDPDFDEDIPF